MITRTIEPLLKEMSSQFKAVAITGPRQSGKTTLTRMVFPDKPYVSLETPDERDRAIRDPRHFLTRFPNGGIIDEIQRAPDLFSYLQENLDSNQQAGRFILTGSQQFGMMEKISQSLAGRAGILTLLPFSYAELQQGRFPTENIDQVLWQSAYPPIFDQKIIPTLWLDSYISTYIERDMRQIINIQNTTQFQRFLSLCAGNIGQLFNASRIGNDCGLNHGTIGKWLSILETSYIAFRLTPHHKNFRKRVVKTPKIYFWDVGLAIRLLGIETPEHLATHPLRGSLFENWVLVELLKARYNKGRRNNLFFWRNNTGLEIDILAEKSGKLMPIEIKSGATLATDWFKGINQWLQLAGSEAMDPALIYGGDSLWQEGSVSVIPWKQIETIAGKI